MATPRKSLVLPILMMLVALPTLIALGVWQWQRKAEKEMLITRIEQRANAPARAVLLTELVKSGATADDLDFTPVTLKGRFLHESEVRTFTNLAEEPRRFGGPGYDIITLFAADGGGYVLVDRGFVPPERRMPDTRKAGQVEEAITITGLIRRPERRSYLDVPDRPDRNEFAIRDPKAILAANFAAKLSSEELEKLAPVIDSYYIDMRGPAPDGGLPQPGRTVFNIPNSHLQYALTWWGLAIVFIGMFGLFLRQQLKQD